MCLASHVPGGRAGAGRGGCLCGSLYFVAPLFPSSFFSFLWGQQVCFIQLLFVLAHGAVCQNKCRWFSQSVHQCQSPTTFSSKNPSLRCRTVRLPPTPCRVCCRPCVFNNSLTSGKNKTVGNCSRQNYSSSRVWQVAHEIGDRRQKQGRAQGVVVPIKTVYCRTTQGSDCYRAERKVCAFPCDRHCSDLADSSWFPETHPETGEGPSHIMVSSRPHPVWAAPRHLAPPPTPHLRLRPKPSSRPPLTCAAAHPLPAPPPTPHLRRRLSSHRHANLRRTLAYHASIAG